MVLHLVTERPTGGEGKGGGGKGEKGEKGEKGKNEASGYLVRPLSPSPTISSVSVSSDLYVLPRCDQYRQR